MFENLNWWEIGALLLIALLIFGDRLPKAISDGLRMLRNVREMARNATTDLSRELGTDIQLEDLHPKSFIRKHLLSEEDEQAIRKPLQGILDDVRDDLNGVKKDINGVKQDLGDVGRSAKHVGKTPAAEPAPQAGPSPTPAIRRYDVDAT